MGDHGYYDDMTPMPSGDRSLTEKQFASSGGHPIFQPAETRIGVPDHPVVRANVETTVTVSLDSGNATGQTYTWTRAEAEAILAALNEAFGTAPDNRPHSRACGIHPHPHGAACHRNCPTCGDLQGVRNLGPRD